MQIKTLLEMKQHLLPIKMPSTLELLTLRCADDDGGAGALADVAADVVGVSASQLVWIPQDDVYGVEGCCFTGPVQVGWIGQLCLMPNQWVVHEDSKFKLHHGDWVLTTMGTHYLRWDDHNQKLVTSFAPFIYLICKQHETVGAGRMANQAALAVGMKYFNVKLQPGACMADHCDGLRTAYRLDFPGVQFGTCWPHIIRKYREGEYTKKSWAHHEDVVPHLQSIHLAHTPEMRDLLMVEYGKVWDSWGHQMDVFWSSYCKKGGGWDVWSVGLFDCMLCTPSQQTQESWHKQLSVSKIPGMFKGSTEVLIKETMPQLIDMDALQIPSELTFHVECVPKAMVKKALWYVDHQETHIHAWKTTTDDGATVFSYYVLRKDQKLGVKGLSKRIMEMYTRAADGIKDPRIKDLSHLTDLCGAFQAVGPMDDKYKVPVCEYNPANLDCYYCKGFKHVGICSHVLCLNHILKRINLRRLVMEIGQNKCSKNKTGVGRPKKPEPALTKAARRQPCGDSSDEEEERLRLLGEQGK